MLNPDEIVLRGLLVQALKFHFGDSYSEEQLVSQAEFTLSGLWLPVNFRRGHKGNWAAGVMAWRESQVVPRARKAGRVAYLEILKLQRNENGAAPAHEVFAVEAPGLCGLKRTRKRDAHRLETPIEATLTCAAAFSFGDAISEESSFGNCQVVLVTDSQGWQSKPRPALAAR